MGIPLTMDSGGGHVAVYFTSCVMLGQLLASLKFQILICRMGDFAKTIPTQQGLL